MNALTRAMDSSVAVRAFRRIAAGSAVYAAVVSITRWPRVTAWLRETDHRISVGFGGQWSDLEERRTVEQLDALASSSRLVHAVTSLVSHVTVAWAQSGVRRALHGAMSVDLDDRIRTGGVAIIVAVVTHTVLLWLFGVPVGVLGWSTRAILLIVGAIGGRRPDAVASAWRARQSAK